MITRGCISQVVGKKEKLKQQQGSAQPIKSIEMQQMYKNGHTLKAYSVRQTRGSVLSASAEQF